MGLLSWLFGKKIDPAVELEIKQNIESFYKSLDGRYISLSETNALSDQFKSAHHVIKSTKVRKKNVLYPTVQKFLSDYSNLPKVVANRNEAFVPWEINRCDALLSDIDGKSLDEQQRTVVVTDEDRMLVLAGAGSGKTLTIAGKVKYLCEERKVSPDDILLIAFTRKSAEEMTERIAKRLGISIEATTFHKLGLGIVTAATGKRPDVRDDLSDFVRNYFENEIVNQPKVVKQLIEFFAYYLNIPADMKEYDSLGDAYAHEKSADFETIKSKYDRSVWMSQVGEEQRKKKRTLKDEQVRSLEEVSIANFLFLNGVNYEYEKLYPFESDDPTRKAYRPDFYLPDYDIYIEHFGISKDNRLPWLSEIEEKKYLEGMKWKRQIHKENGTTLLETYSYLSNEGQLLDYLDRLLKENGVKYKEPDFLDIFDKLYQKQGDKYYAEFISLCCTFITLFKSKGNTPEQVSRLHPTGERHQSYFYQARTALFKDIIKPLMVAYEADLENCGDIDFSDMINRAAKYIIGGYRVHQYRYVIIDEYQDISMARFSLVKAILDQTGAKLLCVGDDWQSIYRFAGSDITLFTHFEEYSGRGIILKLERTYRNAQQLIDEAGRFVMKNPEQMTKNLRSPRSLEYPVVFMCYDEDPFRVLKRSIDKIITDFGSNATILLLGRTNADKQLLVQSGMFEVKKDDAVTYLASPDTPISFLTVHRSKGLEADNVVLLNFQNSTLGFPNKIADDPLLELVLTAPEEYDYAEERRLFYVAITRTRNRVFILTDRNRPSEFFKEFEPSSSVFILDSSGNSEEQIQCPKCKTGHLLVRKNESMNQFFVGCSNYPRCDYAVPDTSILTTNKRCPECGGFLTLRKGKYGRFYGCTNYPLCSHTEKVEES